MDDFHSHLLDIANIVFSALYIGNCLECFDTFTCWLSGERSLTYGLLVKLWFNSDAWPKLVCKC